MNTYTQNLEYLKNLTLLYIEDEDDTRVQFCKFLRRLVGTLITANNGAEGLVAYRKHSPDIILTDIQTPVMDGLFMASEIRNTNKSIPIIVLTAFEQIDYLKKSVNIGVTRYITKPCDCQHLQEILFEQAQRLQVEQELKQIQKLLLDERNRLADIVKGLQEDLNSGQTPAEEKAGNDAVTETAINQIGELHQCLVCLVDLLDNIYNCLIEESENSLEHSIAELFDYTLRQFAEEEQKMLDNDYPEKIEHAKEHDMFTRQVARFKQDMIDGKGMLAMEMVSFLKKWLLNHMQNCDGNYHKFLAKADAKLA
jgi:hemerythrin-like metal-binding protein